MIRRGHRSYINLFNETTTTETLEVPEKRGRNEDLIKQRNELLIHRHYFHSKIKGCKGYDELLDRLTKEFFLTERTVIDIVQNNPGTLSTLRNINPSVKYFKVKFPFMNWDC